MTASAPLHAPICGLDWSRPYVMGIVNVTDDSFSGDGLRGDAAAAIALARAQVAAGADLIDLGAESTRPGAAPVTPAQEIDRLLPVLAGLNDLQTKDGRRVPISVDTRNAATMRAVASAGANIINDISALEGPGSLEAAAETGLPVVLMHMQGEPGSMQAAPKYHDVVAEVHAYLAARVEACIAAGLPQARIILDPGIGFGKTVEHNLSLLRHLDRFTNLNCPLLIGVSRKRFLGAVTGEQDAARRAPASIAAGLWAVAQGQAAILRVHDVAETAQAVKAWQAIAKPRAL